MYLLSIHFFYSEDADALKRFFGIDLVSRSEFLLLFSASEFDILCAIAPLLCVLFFEPFCS